ncbi:hypothetical protein QC762_123710 [Podospora pseudocomata]|uniref:RanBP2-type domain-containing protein n=1 Tax=Podospora pseudocomata TaxID=2093779 RepID=A0ABR0GZB6_9PEZI|nr:hypothetical protein QC762_123710 [Podospora pseudocomata]
MLYSSESCHTLRPFDKQTALDHHLTCTFVTITPCVSNYITLISLLYNKSEPSSHRSSTSRLIHDTSDSIHQEPSPTGKLSNNTTSSIPCSLLAIDTGKMALSTHCVHVFQMIKADNTLIEWTCHLCHSGPHWWIYECRYCKIHTCQSAREADENQPQTSGRIR